MRVKGMRRRLYLLTYDKPAINKKALKIKRSFDEVKRLLNPSGCGK